jgi:hypothetical protein
MPDPRLVSRAQRAATMLERAWDRWRAAHGLAAEPLPPVSSYVGYSIEEPWGRPRVVFGVDAADAEKLATLLHECAASPPATGQPGPDAGSADALPAPDRTPHHSLDEARALIPVQGRTRELATAREQVGDTDHERGGAGGERGGAGDERGGAGDERGGAGGERGGAGGERGGAGDERGDAGREQRGGPGQAAGSVNGLYPVQSYAAPEDDVLPGGRPGGATGEARDAATTDPLGLAGPEARAPAAPDAGDRSGPGTRVAEAPVAEAPVAEAPVADTEDLDAAGADGAADAGADEPGGADAGGAGSGGRDPDAAGGHDLVGAGSRHVADAGADEPGGADSRGRADAGDDRDHADVGADLAVVDTSRLAGPDLPAAGAAAADEDAAAAAERSSAEGGSLPPSDSVPRAQAYGDAVDHLGACRGVAETMAAELAGWAAGELPGQASARLAAWAVVGGASARNALDAELRTSGGAEQVSG